MKTIFRTTRPQNKYIGFSLLLLIAVFGLFIGGVKPPTGDVTNIGGNGTVVVPAPTPVVLTSQSDIGGQHVPRDTSPLGYVSKTEIGGQRVPGDANPLGLLNCVAIGGQGVETRNFSGRNATDIGGNGGVLPSPTLPIIGLQETEIGGQHVPHGIPFSIGGGTIPQETRGINRNENLVIGVNNGAPQVPLPFGGVQPHEIGGNGTPMPTLPLVGANDKCERSGKSILRQPTLRLVSIDSKPTGLIKLAVKPICMRKYSMFDFNEDFALVDLEEIGGGQIVSQEKEDIGGAQTAPREAKEIGGQQGAPRP